VRVRRTERIVMSQTRWRGPNQTAMQLDASNIKILSAMWKFGPRNLLEVSRRTGIPFGAVYYRVAKLEGRARDVWYLIPQVSKLGLVRIVLLVRANPFCEETAIAALKLPNLWRTMNRCEGLYTHISVQSVPVNLLRDFRKYMRQLHELGLTKGSRIVLTGDYVPNFPNFKYYNPKSNQWSYDWSRWLRALKKKAVRMIEDPQSYDSIADKKDMIIIKELQLNARKSFASIAEVVGISLQAVKYRYDRKLVPTGIAQYSTFDVMPHPGEVSAYHETFLNFASLAEMNRFYSLLGEFFFVLGAAKVLHQNALIVRTCTLQNQVWKLFDFFSQMIREGILESYSSVRHDFRGRQGQTVSYEIFEDGKGWVVDFDKCLREVSRLTQVAPVARRV
jgi:DNA-binding Lrp family transcriptional regulator